MTNNQLEVWINPERALYIEVDPHKYTEEQILDYLNNNESFVIYDVFGKAFIFNVNSITYMILHDNQR